MSELAPEPRDDSFGQRIQRLRRRAGLTQRQLAGKLGIDFTYLSKLENGRGEPPSEDLVRRMAEEFGIDAEELLAKAGKLPSELRERAQEDVQFATLLRALPRLSEDELRRVYRSAGVGGSRRRRRQE